MRVIPSPASSDCGGGGSPHLYVLCSEKSVFSDQCLVMQEDAMLSPWPLGAVPVRGRMEEVGF